jgi:uncharacterized protein
VREDERVPPTTRSFERIAVVDVLRAFALLGIIITHAAMGFLAGPAPDPQFMTFSPLDRIVSRLENLFTFGKFFTIFAFLFGLSFAIQLDNAAQKGAAFSGRFAWRLIVLLVIGFVHNLFFSGDILAIYAILGLLLIPCRTLSSRTLLIAALVLVLNVPGLLLGIAQLNAPTPTPEQMQARAEAMQQFMAAAQHQFQIKQSGALAEVIALNFGSSWVSKLFFLVFTGRLWITFGLFLLGLYAGRMNVFRESDAHRRMFHRLMIWAGVVALVATVVAIVRPSTFVLQSAGDLLATFSFSVQQASLSAFYVAAVTLLFWNRSTQKLLAPLAPLGKMGLTTYLMQSMFGLIVFYGFGFGLLGRLGAAASVGLGILIFIGQVAFARWWLSRFNMGPVEWLWRSLTYLRLQPNARSQTTAA